jgi:hypothetical protein
MQQAGLTNEPSLWLDSFDWLTAGQHKYDRDPVGA